MDLADTNKKLSEIERKISQVSDTSASVYSASSVIIDPHHSSNASSVLQYIKGEDFNDDLYEQIASRSQNNNDDDDYGIYYEDYDEDYLPSPPRSPPREIDPERHYGMYEFSGPDPSHCTLERDEPVYLLNDDDNYWWLIRKLSKEEKPIGSPDDPEDGKIGFVPAECLETYAERLARLNCFKNEELEKEEIKEPYTVAKTDKKPKKVVKFEDVDEIEEVSFRYMDNNYDHYDNDFDDKNDKISILHGPEKNFKFEDISENKIDELGGISRPIVVMDQSDEDDEVDECEIPRQAFPNQMFSMGLLNVPRPAKNPNSGANSEVLSEIYSERELVLEKRKKSSSPVNEIDENESEHLTSSEINIKSEEVLHESILEQLSSQETHSMPSKSNLHSKLESQNKNFQNGNDSNVSLNKVEEFLEKLQLAEPDSSITNSTDAYDEDIKFELPPERISNRVRSVSRSSELQKSLDKLLQTPEMNEFNGYFETPTNEIFNNDTFDSNNESSTSMINSSLSNVSSAHIKSSRGPADPPTPSVRKISDLTRKKRKKKRKDSPRFQADHLSIGSISPDASAALSGWGSRASSDSFRRSEIMDKLNQMTADIQEQFGLFDEIANDNPTQFVEIPAPASEEIKEREIHTTQNSENSNGLECELNFTSHDDLSDTSLSSTVRRSTVDVNIDNADGDTPLTSTASLVDKRERSISDMFVPILGKFDELAEKLAELNSMV